jgi:hypothetical protein
MSRVGQVTINKTHISFRLMKLVDADGYLYYGMQKKKKKKKKKKIEGCLKN